MRYRRIVDQKTKNLLKAYYGNKCAICGKVTDHTEIDHIIPLFDGGGNCITNLQVVCYECHKKKSAKELSDFQKSRIDLVEA